MSNRMSRFEQKTTDKGRASDSEKFSILLLLFLIFSSRLFLFYESTHRDRRRTRNLSKHTENNARCRRHWAHYDMHVFCVIRMRTALLLLLTIYLFTSLFEVALKTWASKYPSLQLIFDELAECEFEPYDWKANRPTSMKLRKMCAQCWIVNFRQPATAQRNNAKVHQQHKQTFRIST